MGLPAADESRDGAGTGAILDPCGVAPEVGDSSKNWAIVAVLAENMTDRDLNKFNIHYQPQIQRMVHDLRKNDGGIMQKFKRITNKNPPIVPQRDYTTGGDDNSEEEFSDFDPDDYVDPDEQSDSETYAVPSEENDDEDNYEPPPTEPETMQQTIHFNSSNGGYADKKPLPQLPAGPSPGMNKPARQLPKLHHSLPRTSQPSPPPGRLPLPPKPTQNKPFPNTHPGPRPKINLSAHPGMKKPYAKETSDDEEDYISPNDESNYIEPTQDKPAYKPPVVNRMNKPTVAPSKSQSHPTNDPTEHEFYEVPENEVKPSPPSKRDPPAQRRNSPPKIEQHNGPESTDPFLPARPDPQSKHPSPVPRVNKTKLPPILQKPGLPSRDGNSNIDKPTVPDRPRQHSIGSESNSMTPPPNKFSLPPSASKPNFAQRPPEITNRFPVAPSRNNLPSTAEQEAGVVNKEWYASSCDRKTAEDALQASCKDGSFLIRKSSGQDSQQPYTLVVFYNRKVYNIPVRYIESLRQYALGKEKSGEERFSSVAEIIENHKRTSLVLIDSQNNTKDSTKLKFPVIIP
uniref:SH2 domain-containing protein n=1 Tax=Leptobrachium leishanense TaxID=445787 RepID=A0A8C5PIZ1_9ANUR